MGMSVLSMVPTPQSVGEGGEKMILTEGRREYESQLAQCQRRTKRKCSVSALSIGNVSGVGTGGINAFVIWRSAQEELHRPAPLSRIYSRFTEKIHVFVKSYHSLLLR